MFGAQVMYSILARNVIFKPHIYHLALDSASIIFPLSQPPFFPRLILYTVGIETIPVIPGMGIRFVIIAMWPGFPYPARRDLEISATLLFKSGITETKQGEQKK